MLEVQLGNIMPVSEGHSRFDELVNAVSNSDDLFVMTRDGKPVAVLVGAQHLETLTGNKQTNLMDKAIEPAQTNPDNTTASPTFTYDNVMTETLEDASAPAPIQDTDQENVADSTLEDIEETPVMSDSINDTASIPTDENIDTMDVPAEQEEPPLVLDNQATEPVSTTANTGFADQPLTSDPMMPSTDNPTDENNDPNNPSVSPQI